MTRSNDSTTDGQACAGMKSLASLPPEAQQVHQWLRERRRILVLTHERPDGDAFGSLYGAVEALRAIGHSACGLTEISLPRRFTGQFPRLRSVSVASGDASIPEEIDGVLCLDASSRDRVVPSDALAGLSVCNIDHHRDNTRFGDVNWVDPSAAAVGEMLATLFGAAGWLTETVADCLLNALLTDTGGLRFPNTSPHALRTAAHLSEEGARYAEVMDGLFFQEPIERRRLEAHLIETAVSECDGQFLYAVLDSQDIKRRGLSPPDLEGLIDVLRSVEGVQIACLIQPANDAVRLSLRARSAATPVDGIAHQLGGGGHPLAAGVRIADVDTDDAINKVLYLVEKVISGT